MTWQSALSFFLAVFIFGITPGPGVLAILARSLVSGARACLFLALGMIISDIFYLIAACIGLAALASHWSEVFTAIRILGAVYLIYLGWKMWHAPLPIANNHANNSARGDALSFLQGFLISASNPKVILFYIAFLPTFIDLNTMNTQTTALAAVLTFFALLLGLLAIAIFAARARKFFHSERAVQRLNRGAGSVMMAAGAYLAARH